MNGEIVERRLRHNESGLRRARRRKLGRVRAMAAPMPAPAHPDPEHLRVLQSIRDTLARIEERVDRIERAAREVSS